MAMRWRKSSRLRNRPSDVANVAGRAPGGRPRRLPQRSARVEDEQCDGGTNSGRQVKAGQVLAVPPKCAVMSVAAVAAVAAASATFDPNNNDYSYNNEDDLKRFWRPRSSRCDSIC